LRDEAEILRGGQYSQAELSTLLAANVLLQFPNVLVTPHIAYNIEDAVHRISSRRRSPTSKRSRGTERRLLNR
jgi:D-lactate dehydrogenase